MASPIQHQTSEWPEQEVISSLHPYVKEWFVKKFSSLSPPQRYSVKNIKDGANTLISSPTGSGKTLSAFLAIIDNLITRADEGLLEDHVYAVYVSPLKALANDIDKNLKEPLKEITTIARERSGKRLDIRVSTRTGDTPASEKARMLKKPPHILITTPESLAISLASTKFSSMVSQADYVIIDEIHALADNKRGTQLSLCLEQLEDARHVHEKTRALVRVGLSATVRPLEDVARFLVGLEKPGVSRPCRIVDVSFLKQLDLKVLSATKDLINTSYEDAQDALYNLLHDLIRGHRTTLVFTNTRSATERVVHNLKQRYPKDYTGIIGLEEEGSGEHLIGAHHGSLSKEHRTRIENNLKDGRLKAVVCSTSLELGIDIGYVDLVILLGSPKSVARGLQRIGRSGHQLHETAKGRIIVMDRDDLVECSVLLKSALEQKIDTIHIPKGPLDVLSQTIYGLAIARQWHIEELYNLLTRAMPYETLSREQFMSVIGYLAGEYASLEERHVYAKIWYDKETGMIGRKGRLARLIYMTNQGTIPDETAIKVKLGDVIIGTITEAFLERLKPGDVFVLGGEAYEFRYSRGLTASVRTSGGRPPTVPSWISEMLPLSFELALEIQRLREHLATLFERGAKKNEIVEYLDEYLYVDKNALEAIYGYFREQHAYSTIPHARRLVIEQFKDGNTRYAIFHTLFGRRVNDVLSRALAFAHARVTGRDVELGITDNGFYLKSTRAIPARRLWSLLDASELERVMKEALEKTEVLRLRFRHCAARALMILREYKGRTKSVGKQQMSSRLLLNAVRELGEDFPILSEARREVLEDLMDFAGARKVLEMRLPVEEVFCELPSPFSFNMVLHSYTDLLRVEDRVAFLQRMHKMVLERVEGRKVVFEAPAVEFSYDRLWEEQQRLERQKQDDYVAYLHERFRAGARKSRLDFELSEDGHRLIDGLRHEVRDEFWEWASDLLSGTVPKAWHDDVVLFLQEELKRKEYK